MQLIESFIKLFFSNYSFINKRENDEVLEFECETTSYLSPDVTSLATLNSFLQKRDKLIFTINFGEADPITFNSSSANYSDFIKTLNDEYKHQQGEKITSRFSISKSNVNSKITIYDLNVFSTTISQLNIAEAFSTFNRIFKNNHFLNFEVLNLNNCFNTATLSFSPINELGETTPLNRLIPIENLKASSYYINIDEHNLIPNDFKLITQNNEFPVLNGIFNRYATILAIIYLFDITSIKDNELEFKINGYKSIKGVVDLSSISIEDLTEYYDIYEWVYNGGNLNDKIGLARNIISLHFKKSGELYLVGNAFQSILSSYNVYEKQNIKQYIEIRNKISDQLIDFNVRANKIIDSFASGFQKSALAVLSFYISTIAIKVLGKGSYSVSDIFSLDATVLSLAILLCFAIYYFVSRWEVKQQKTRFIESYSNLKERYTDLLNQEDIKRILNNDKEFNNDINFIDNKLKAYSIMWWSFITILTVSTLWLFLSYNISLFLDVPLIKFLLNHNCNC